MKTGNQLMDRTLVKYTTLKTKELWEAPTLEDVKMLVLEARIDSLNKKLATKNRDSVEKREPP